MVKWQIERFDTLESTNTYLKILAEKGAKEGLVIVADSQTSGRGRRGKSFFSPSKTGLYMSFLIRPKASPEETLFVTTAAAVALCRAIEKIYPHKPMIKWVNDVYLGDKKVAGILTEASFKSAEALDFVIVGVGVNVTTEIFPEEIEDIALSLGKEDKRDLLLKAVLEEFSAIYDSFPSHDFYEEYKSRSMLIGREIEILGDEKRFGKVIGVDNRCHLIVELENKEIISLSTGEVSTRLKTV
ncbi:MAG: biotin--[Clostridia bacterium]|nr:biotin--[acetyl-CoA-carboxylase] ligase [Clostridia bacterium]